MRTLIILAAVMATLGCRREERQIDTSERIKMLEGEVAKLSRNAPARWAVADRTQITQAMATVAREKIEELKKKPGWPADLEGRLGFYNGLKSQTGWMQEQAIRMGGVPGLRTNTGIPPSFSPASSGPATNGPQPPRFAVPPPPSYPVGFEPGLEALKRNLAAAKAPIADFIDQSEAISTRYTGSEALSKLIAAYAQDRFDLVVDRNEKVLYAGRSEPPDITEALIKFFREREQR